FFNNKLGFTLGGGAITNPGLYLVIVPPINGATAFSAPDSRYFNMSPGTQFMAWDGQATLDYMPTRNITFRLEYTHREASVPYFSGPGGVTPPGGNQGAPGSFVSGWSPDLQRDENRITTAFLVRL